ncbi:hypothetical protein [Paenibacillus cremeus]|uniref:hypothetical protein n=1 Tax=Paenibacillus cremeus TaxID=2163881 RepID=UPI0011A1D1F0|nr:hypothetical protein [Paenibacillus cremeus]
MDNEHFGDRETRELAYGALQDDELKYEEAFEESDEPLTEQELRDQEQFETMQRAALFVKSAFPDQIDYFDPETGEII